MAWLRDPTHRRTAVRRDQGGGAHGAFNLGDPDDYRVPDLGYHRESPTTTFEATAAIVVGVVSPDDQAFAKLPFYAARNVDEVLIVDAGSRTARWFVKTGGTYVERPSSLLDGTTSEEVIAALRWPE